MDRRSRTSSTLVLLAASISPLIVNFPGLFHYLQSALAYLVPPVAVVFLLGLFWRRASATGAFATLLGGHLVSALLFTLSLLELLSLHFTIVAGISALASVLIFLLTGASGVPPTDEQVSRFTFDAKTVRRHAALAWWQDYRLYAAILVALTFALVTVHW